MAGEESQQPYKGLDASTVEYGTFDGENKQKKESKFRKDVILSIALSIIFGAFAIYFVWYLLYMKPLVYDDPQCVHEPIVSDPPPRMLVLCGPSGVGKSTMIKYLMREYSDLFGFAPSHTTRPPRPKEKNGTDYYYTTKDVMIEGIKNCRFLDHSEYVGNIYGLSVQAVQDVASEGKIVVKDLSVYSIDMLKNYPELDVTYVLIRTPNLEALASHLAHRDTETPEQQQKRVMEAESELAYAETKNFSLILTNIYKPETYRQLKNFLIERYHIENRTSTTRPPAA